MSLDPYLHDHRDFKALLEIVGDDLNIVPQLIEKDYWIMHCLWGLQQQFFFELKGGTSLSKGFNIIERFSEDLDIHIEPPTSMDVKVGKNQDSPAQVESRKHYFAWLAKNINIPGIDSVDRDTTFDDLPDLRGAGIRLHYESHFSSLAGIKEGVLLEAGFDDTAPNREVVISSWAFDRASEQRIPIADNRAVGVKCYAPEYTFVEKLQTVSTKFRQQQAKGTMPTDFLRHYYDIHQLLAVPEVQAFIGTATYEERKRIRFRQGDNLTIAENEAFLLRDADVRSLYDTEYRKTTALYYKGQIPFKDILLRIEENLPRL